MSLNDVEYIGFIARRLDEMGHTNKARRLKGIQTRMLDHSYSGAPALECPSGDCGTPETTQPPKKNPKQPEPKR